MWEASKVKPRNNFQMITMIKDDLQQQFYIHKQKNNTTFISQIN